MELLLLGIAMLGGWTEPPAAVAVQEPSTGWKLVESVFDAERCIIKGSIDGRQPVQLEIKALETSSALWEASASAFGMPRLGKEGTAQYWVLQPFSMDFAGRCEAIPWARVYRRDPSKAIVRVPSDGFLGVDVLLSRPLWIDYEHRQMWVSDGACPAIPGGEAIAAKISQYSGVNLVCKMPNVYGQMVDVEAMLWMDEDLSLAMTDHCFHILGRDLEDDSDVKTLMLGSQTLTNLPTRAVDEEWPLAKQADVFIGYKVLRQFDVVIDGPGSRVILKPNKFFGRADQETPVGMSTRIKFIAESGQVWRVEAVTPDSPAAKAGFEVGDSFKTIDGLSASQWAPGSFGDLLWRHIDEPIKFTVTRGEADVELVLTPVATRK